MKLETVLKSTLVAISLFAFGAVADEQIDNNSVTNERPSSAVIIKRDNVNKKEEAILVDLDEATLKSMNNDTMTDAEKADLSKRIETKGTKIASRKLNETDSQDSTENCWGGWGGRYRWGGCGGYYGGYYNRPYCGGYPYYGGQAYGYYGGYGYRGCGYYGYGGYGGGYYGNIDGGINYPGVY